MSTQTLQSASALTSDEQRWNAVVARDPSADDHFVFAVVTTGIYCRPSCPARRPHRCNVTFHDCVADAQRAGFRACKRCRPDESSVACRQTQTIAAACRAIENASAMPNLDTLAANAGMSRFHFHRIFTALTGVTPKAYADGTRRERVQQALTTRASVTEAIYDAGFNSSGRFYAASSALLGMTPTAYRQGGRGETIRFAVGECWLGSVLVAATERGICAISLGDDPGALVQELESRFAEARLAGGEEAFEALIATVLGFIAAPGQASDLPLDVRGSAFQQRVWQALREIPAGSTASYADIARRIDQPQAFRAVAGACAANPVAVAIPCHRVVRNDGALSGYRWGVDRKRALLEREAAGRR